MRTGQRVRGVEDCSRGGEGGGSYLRGGGPGRVRRQVTRVGSGLQLADGELLDVEVDGAGARGNPAGGGRRVERPSSPLLSFSAGEWEHHGQVSCMTFCVTCVAKCSVLLLAGTTARWQGKARHPRLTAPEEDAVAFGVPQADPPGVFPPTVFAPRRGRGRPRHRPSH